MKKLKALIVLIVSFALIVLFSISVYAISQETNTTNAFDNKTINTEWIVLIITEISSLIILLITTVFDRRKLVRELEKEKNFNKTSEITAIVNDVYSVFTESMGLFDIKNTKINPTDINNKIHNINISVINNCSLDATKLVRHYQVKMDKYQQCMEDGKDIGKTNCWYFSYLATLHSVLKYEVSGYKVPPYVLLSTLFEGKDNEFYKELKRKTIKIILESNISKSYIGKGTYFVL